MLNRLINGILIVLVGAILLMNTTGTLPWAVWDAAVGYWPILIIGLGIQVALSKWRVPGLALALIVVLIISVLYPYPGGGFFSPYMKNRMFFRRAPTGNPLQYSKELEVPGGPEVSILEMALIAPSLDFRAQGDPALSASSSEYATIGDLSWDRYEPVFEASQSQNGQRVQVTVKSSGKEGQDAGRQFWDLRINPSLTAAIQVSGGVADLNLDLDSFFAEKLIVAAGVTNVEIRCGLSGKETDIAISGGIANVEMEVPETAGLKVTVSGPPLVTRLNFGNLGLVKQGNSWFSKDYSSASTKINVEVSCGAGKVTLRKAP